MRQLKKGIGSYIVALYFAVAALVFVNIGGVLWLFTAQKTDALVVDMAGRQRMLAQKYAREELIGAGGGAEAAGYAARAEKTMLLFEDTLKKLSTGGDVTVDPVKKVTRPIPGAANPDVRAKLAGVSVKWLDLKKAADVVVKTKRGDDGHEEAWGKFLKLTDEIVVEMNETVKVLVADSEKKSARIKLMEYALGLVAAGLCACTFVFLRRRLLGPVAEITDSLSAISGNVYDGASNVLSAGQAISDSAMSQASSLEETTSSLEHISEMTQNNAVNSEGANELARSAADTARKGYESVSVMKEAMSQIEASSRETAKIIKKIDEISFQTNLLALNAAVEAARAGDAGRGFSVVAEEVRSLAQKAADAARSSADVIESSIRNTKRGVEIAESFSGALEEINNVSEKVSKFVSDIAMSCDQQARQISMISAAVQELNRHTTENASHSEGAAAASEELHRMSGSLSEIVSKLSMLVRGAVAADVFDAGSTGAAGASSFGRTANTHETRLALTM